MRILNRVIAAGVLCRQVPDPAVGSGTAHLLSASSVSTCVGP